MTKINSINNTVKTNVETKLRSFRNLGALKMNFGLRCNQKEINAIVSDVDKIVSRVKEDDTVKTRQFELKGKFPPYKYAIIDLEGEPPKFFGLVISNQVYQIFVTKTKYLLDLYDTVWKILNKLIDFYLFTFSNHEARFFKRIITFNLKEGKDKSFFKVLKKYSILTRLKV